MKKIFLTLTLILAFVLSINNYVFAVDGIQFITVNEKSMRAYVKGSGDTTIVMLSGWGTESPIDDFMPLADKLSSDYIVVSSQTVLAGLEPSKPASAKPGSSKPCNVPTDQVSTAGRQYAAWRANQQYQKGMQDLAKAEINTGVYLANRK